MINSRSTVINEVSTATPKRCGHPRHVGCCPCCQRAQLARWSMQLTEATANPRARQNRGGRHV